MTIVQVNARATFQENDLVFLELERNGQTVTMTTRQTATLEELALLILAQQMPAEPDRTLQKRVTIDAHQETGEDPDGGEFQFWVVDGVTLEQLTDEAARDGYAGLPGWADWTADEAAVWIEENVTDLQSAKVALTQMARAITLLRDF